MSDLKNSFTMRNGKMIFISEVKKVEKGKACSCVCAFCKLPMLACMGDIYRHYFIHVGAGCSDVKAFESLCTEGSSK